MSSIPPVVHGASFSLFRFPAMPLIALDPKLVQMFTTHFSNIFPFPPHGSLLFKYEFVSSSRIGFWPPRS
ncbi:hypothetical protein K443DRAFT_680715 [Laccaria amethystina LaAM-08-1]|uniref:Uncharacterized protein n=1 Tax=Laccaria amethystina LaAM-08-1 TaxID=1095629 RepID=A0A0C9XLZ8_9AGAR|nr:hypothetical protein K443DRAFT_680715 [Laccaria amethystina LaAM-08-1]